eukprot:TRINITY_DN10150_c1_g2_i1.p1 TRINITY_DN10150_c1_g2~~TRINITY_DN10150_c1_g2_i1.p1  ORF type:complete len:549 (+),score=86.84 TRINITY_DN10150_c1_g2_i1:56-1648(+)
MDLLFQPTEIPKPSPSSELFAESREGVLTERFKGVWSIDEFIELSQGKGWGDVGKLVYHKALSRWFANDAPRFLAFVRSIVASAEAVLRYNATELSSSHFPPVEPEYIECSETWCRGVLAHAMLGNIVGDPVARRKDWRGGLNLKPLLTSTNRVAYNKVCCLVQYFVSTQEDEETSGGDSLISDLVEGNLKKMEICFSPHHSETVEKEEKQRMIIFEKLHLTNKEFEELLFSSSSVPGAASAASFSDKVPLKIHNGTMEQPEAAAFVNFANANFGFGKFIPSCTQEEIMQMCCPEFNVGMLFYGKMDHNTVILTHNIRRFSRYKGYLDGFQFVGPLEEEMQGDCNGSARDDGSRDQTIITMDAVHGSHFSRDSNIRDLKKAYLAWRGIENWHKRCSGEGAIAISTGRWGCGAFGGTVWHKCLQQLLAAMLLGMDGDKNVCLLFSSFNDDRTAEELRKLCEAVAVARRSRHVTVADILEKILIGRDRYTVDQIICLLQSLGRSQEDGPGTPQQGSSKRGDSEDQDEMGDLV